MFALPNQQDSKPQFTYTDILKKIFLINIPKLLLEKNGKTIFYRPDDFYTNISPNELDKTIDKEKNLVDFVVKTEINRENNSDFKKFKEFFLAEKVLDRYTIIKFSMMLHDLVVANIKQLLPENPDLNLKELLYYAHHISGDWISHYLFEKNELLRQNIESNEQDIKDSDYHTIYKCQHLEKAKNSYSLENVSAPPPLARREPEPSAIDTATSQYSQWVAFNMSLLVAPAITKNERVLQKKIYSAETDARLKFLSNDPWDHNNARAVLGLKPDESYERFICDDYTIPTYAFNFPKAIGKMSEVEIFNHVLITNFGFLKQIDKRRCDPKVYSTIISRLCNAFVNDNRCPAELKKRVFLKKMNIKLSTVILVINNIFYPESNPPAQSINELFFNALKTSGKDNLGFLQEFIASIPTQAQEISDDELKKTQTQIEKLDISKSKTLAAMSKLLQCSYFSEVQKTELLGIMAKAKYSAVASCVLRKKHGFYREIIRDVKPANAVPVQPIFASNQKSTFWSWPTSVSAACQYLSSCLRSTRQ